jgi:hypothetical protein
MTEENWIEAAVSDLMDDPRTQELKDVPSGVIASIISEHHRHCELWEVAVRLRMHVEALQFGQDGRCPTCGERRHDVMCAVGKVLKNTDFLDEEREDDE